MEIDIIYIAEYYANKWCKKDFDHQPFQGSTGVR